MSAACNSSPIIALSSIGQLHLLTSLFSSVFVPEAVFVEICRNTEREQNGKVQLTSAVEKAEVQLFKVQNQALAEKLSGRLHRGELEVIIGAIELGIPSVILDDRQARGLAETYKLDYTGTVGLLIMAKSRDLIPEVTTFLDRLAQEGFRLSEDLYRQVLMATGEA